MHAELIFPEGLFPANHAPTVAETHAGLVCAWFSGAREGHADVVIRAARRTGAGWTDPVVVAEGVQPDGSRLPCWNPVLFAADGGPLLLFYKVGAECSTWWGMLTRSQDGGQTWSPHVRLPAGVLGPIKNKPVAGPGGTLLCPTSCEAEGWRIRIQSTSDLGETWTSSAFLNANDWRAIQPSILLWPGGRMQLLSRTDNGCISQVWSTDGGKTFGPMTATELPNPNSGTDAAMLQDGRALLVYNHARRKVETWGARSPLNLATSSDGQRWEPLMTLESQPGEYSYPAVIQGRDGRIHVVYTYNRKSIKYVTLLPQDLDAARNPARAGAVS
ncbi:MAG: exo-alpha-sialidase [Planctomycetota bacterium]|nr:exo-alpha-sialidase [Planctomycetota bacterium]